MKLHICRILILLFCIGLLAGCGSKTVPTETAVAAEPVEMLPPETTEPETEPTAAEIPEHSDLYISGVSVEDVILYFNEVCLDAEYYTEGNPQYLQKWTEPIRYAVGGSPTGEDLQVLETFCSWLNTVPGFPGMEQVEQMAVSNWRIYFCDAAEMKDRMGDTFVNMDGAVTFWYYGDDEIYEAIVCCLSTVDQSLRSSVIQEEMYNGLGPVQDTVLRPDSIISADYGQPEAMTEVDRLILMLLYHPDMKCGMDMTECEAVIRQLYW